MKIKIIHLFIFLFLSLTVNKSQEYLNMTEHRATVMKMSELKKISQNYSSKNSLKLSFIQKFYINSNLPNLENQNGIYLPKGYGLFKSALLNFNSKNLFLSVEPTSLLNREYKNDLPIKENIFSVLNDTKKNKNINLIKIRNFGFTLNYNYLYVGYGNWNSWWGPGTHNSIILSNNSEGFYNYVLGIRKYKINSKTTFNFHLRQSQPIKNIYNNNFFITSNFINICYSNINFGWGKEVLSGGREDFDEWNQYNALFVPITKENNRYWDENNAYHIEYKNKVSGLNIFIEWGHPKQSSLNNNSLRFMDHGIGRNIGFKKLGIFGYEKLLFGFEYLNLLQSRYYATFPSRNWYDNINYNYSSFNQRRWGAHSGSDSDDFLIYFGILSNNLNILFQLNYERHGVTFNFPPEVKFENRISLSYLAKKFEILINYENEKYTHYAFVDSNINVWTQNLNLKSVQRTKTLLISFEYLINIDI